MNMRFSNNILEMCKLLRSYHDKAIMYISFDPIYIYIYIYIYTVILCAFHQGYSVIMIKLCCARGSVLVVGQHIINCMSLL